MDTTENQSPVRTDLVQSLRFHAMAKNSGWNVAGQLFPLLIAAVAIPLLIKRMGVDRFGVLTLAWALVGYFSLFDLGLGRSLTKVASDRLASGKEHELASSVWTAVVLMLAIGGALAVAMCMAAPWLAGRIFKVPPLLFDETRLAIYPLAFAIPLTTATAGLRGLLEAQHRFAMINSVRVGMGVFNFLGPLVAVIFTPSLFVIILVLVVGRVVGVIIHLLLCFHTTPTLKTDFSTNRKVVRELMSIGSWITVSNLVSPIMVYLDRFLIGALLSVSAVAYYTTPFEVVGKIWVIPSSINAVLFPAFAALSVMDKPRLGKVYAQGVRSCFILLFPLVFVITLFAPEGLRVWLGPLFMQNSTPVVHWLVIGLFINSLATFPFALLQAVNRPDLPGKLHLIELPIYVVLVVLAIKAFGLAGAAFVWSLRVSLEGLVLFLMVRKTMIRDAFSTGFILATIAAITLLLAATLKFTLGEKLIFSAAAFAFYFIASWWTVLEKDERKLLLAYAGFPRPGASGQISLP